MNWAKFLLMVLVISTSAKAQDLLGIIDDPDGYTNVRKGPGKDYPIVGRVERNEVFYTEDSIGNWLSIWAIEKSISGYIHSSRVKRLSILRPVGEPVFGSRSVTIGGLSYQFTMALKDFVKADHKIELIEDKWVGAIDGLKPYGVDGNYPTMQIAKFEVKKGGILIKIPNDEVFDLYECWLGGIHMVESADGTVFLSMTGNSDGAGGYDAIWIFQNGKFLKRIIFQM